MKNYSNNYASEFEQEFEGDLLQENDEFEFENDEFENDSEADYLNEFENDEFDENEFTSNNEQDRERHYERRLYELFTNNYESELEFENGFNEIIYEMEQDFFWKKLKNLGKSALKAAMPYAQQVLKQIPGGEKYAPLLQSLTSDPRSFLRNAVKTFGPMALNAVAPGAGSVVGAVLNSEVVVPSGAAKQAAKDTVALSKQALTGFADNIAKMPPTNNLNQLKSNLSTAAKSALQSAKAGLSSQNSTKKHQLVSRKVQQAGQYKVVTSIYKV